MQCLIPPLDSTKIQCLIPPLDSTKTQYLIPPCAVSAGHCYVYVLHELILATTTLVAGECWRVSRQAFSILARKEQTILTS